MPRTLRAIINETVHHFAGINSLGGAYAGNCVSLHGGVRVQMVTSEPGKVMSCNLPSLGPPIYGSSCSV